MVVLQTDIKANIILTYSVISVSAIHLSEKDETSLIL